MTEPVDRVRELGDDRRVDTGVVAGEEVDLRLHLTSELLEGKVLVLHLGDEPCSLEQALTVPDPRRQLPFGLLRRVLDSDDVLDVRGQAVVLGVEDTVHGGEADVLVQASISGDEVGVEHLVVVGACLLSGGGCGDRRVAVCGQTRLRHGVVGDVIEECLPALDSCGGHGDT